jgi:hypothetical protein
MKDDRIRKITMPASIFNTLPAEYGAMSAALAGAAGVADLAVRRHRRNGDVVEVFVTSSGFDVHPCECGARELPVTLPAAD